MWPNLKETADLVTFTEEILAGKLHFLCSAHCKCFCVDFAKSFRKIILENTAPSENYIIIINSRPFVTPIIQNPEFLCHCK